MFNSLLSKVFVFFRSLGLSNFFGLFICLFSFTSNANSIVLAVSNVTSGPAAQLGINLNLGSKVYFDKVNLQGGLSGRKIETIHFDDGYEPYKTFTNVQVFLQRGDIFAFINFIGTPTSNAVIEPVRQSNIPFLMPFTGAEFLRSPTIKNVFHLRSSYYQETEAQIDYLVKQNKAKKIGLLVQADEFGLSVENGYLKALKMRGLAPVVTTRFRRNTQDIKLALDVLQKQQVEVVAFVGTYQPLSQLVKTAIENNYNPLFTTVSFIGSHELQARVGNNSNILVTEVFENPATCQKLICHEFRADMKRSGVTKVNRVQFEGYLNALVFVEVAKLCKSELTRQCFLEKISTFHYQKKGLNIEFSDKNHQGSSDIFLNHL